MAKKIKNNAEMNNNNSNLLFTPERKVIGAEEAKLMASKCSDYNDSSEARNWNRCEFSGIKFEDEDLSGIEAHYTKFVDCEFLNCKLNRLEGHFSTWDNCIFKNCEVENANFSFSNINLSFFDCNMNGSDFPFCQGNLGATQCIMRRVTCNHSSLILNLVRVDAWNFEGNCSNLDLAISGSNFSRAEFCDSTLKGKVEKNTNLTDAELNRSDLSLLHIAYDCATHGMEKEDSTDDEIDSALDKAIHELEEIVEEK